MLYCSRCEKYLYQDVDFVFAYDQDQRSHSVCPDCAADLVGLPPPDRRVYPVGKMPPTTPFGPRADLCCMCRLALRYGEQATYLRVKAEDLAGTEFEDKLIPGGYLACKSCLDIFRPIIMDRLVQTGVIHHPAMFHDGYLA